MSDQTTGDPTITETSVLLRRAPKYPAFMIAGALLGALVTLILTLAFPVQGEATFLQLYGYFLLYGVPIGAIVGAAVALLADRVATRRARTVTAAKLSVHAQQGEQPPQHSTSDDGVS